MLILKLIPRAQSISQYMSSHANKQWSYSNNKFVCSKHGFGFDADCNASKVVQPNSNATSGSLKCYTATVNDNSLVINV